MSKYTLYPGKKVPYTSKKGTKYTVSNIDGEIVCYSGGQKRKPTKEILENFSVSGGKYTVYADGGCRVNPGGAGGYGAVVVDESGTIIQLSEGYKHTTNNRMEMRGAIAGLSHVPRGATVKFYSDSQYVVKTMQGAFSRKKNLDLWKELDKAVKGKKIKYYWVKGHDGNDFNEVCDKLATSAMNGPELLIDEGYDGVKRSVKYSAMSVKINASTEIPHRGVISEICEANIDAFYAKQDHVFKDYASLKTGGIDGYSKLSEEELLDECQADIETVKKHLSGKDVLSALRWNCRGLSLKDSIRKVLVDKEIAENCQ